MRKKWKKWKKWEKIEKSGKKIEKSEKIEKSNLKKKCPQNKLSELNSSPIIKVCFQETQLKFPGDQPKRENISFCFYNVRNS